MTTRQDEGLGRVSKLHARRKFVHKCLDRRPDYAIGVLTGFYVSLAVLLLMGTWASEWALPYKLGLMPATPVIVWGVVMLLGTIALMLIGMYCFPTILWRYMWHSKKIRARHPTWVREVERIEARHRAESRTGRSDILDIP